MRIAFVSQEFPPDTAKGGIGTQAFLKARGMAALGHDVHVISRTGGNSPNENNQQGFRISRVSGENTGPIPHTEIAGWLLHSAAVAREISRIHADKPLDLVEFPEWAAEGYVHLLNQTEWNRIPSAVQLHGPLVMFANALGWPERNTEFYRTGTQMEAACVRLADAVYSSSQCSARWCSEHYGGPFEIPVMHAGVDVQEFTPRAGPKATKPTILFAGKLARNKGVFELLKACLSLAERMPLSLRLLGRGEPSIVAELTNLAANRPGLLELVGFVPREQLPEQYARAQVFAAPSEYEGGPGFVYLEAMACGLPVIACSGSGAEEAVTEGLTGLLVRHGDVPGLSVALERLLANATEREQMGENARQFVLREADTRQCLKRLEQFYLRVASGGQRP